jgi:hypothetical protein
MVGKDRISENKRAPENGARFFSSRLKSGGIPTSTDFN